jgi:hypothetical protein
MVSGVWMDEKGCLKGSLREPLRGTETRYAYRLGNNRVIAWFTM